MERIYSKSFSFILPILDYWDSSFLVNDNLTGCFIGDEDYPELKNHIFLLYKFSGDKWFLNFEEQLQDCDYFVTQYEPDKFHTMFVYDIPVHQQINYDYIKDGKYSKISDSYKQRIIEFHSIAFGTQTGEVVRRVLYKHDSQYEAWEAKINEGLPRSRWTFIPRDQDPAEAMNSDDIYSDKFKQKNLLGKTGK